MLFQEKGAFLWNLRNVLLPVLEAQCAQAVKEAEGKGVPATLLLLLGPHLHSAVVELDVLHTIALL